MKKIFFPFLLVFFSSINTYSQYIYKIKADSVLITNDSCNAELNLENSTKDTLGFLYNKGKGRTEFRKGLIKLNDSLYIIGDDTLNIAKGIGVIPISKLAPAIANNIINNANYSQGWQWNSLGGGSGLKLSSNSTAASANLQRLIEINLSGINTATAQTTTAGYFSNTHTGPSSTNVAMEAIASGGTTNLAGRFTGDVSVSGTTTSNILKIPIGYSISRTGSTTSINSEGNNVIYDLGSNGACTFNMTNGEFVINKTTTAVSRPFMKLGSISSGLMASMRIGLFHDWDAGNQGTVRGNYFGTFSYVTSGDITSIGGNVYGINWIWDNQASTTNPNAIWLQDYNNKVPFLVKKNGRVLIGSSIDAGAYNFQVTGKARIDNLIVAAGTTSAGTAPIKLTVGTNLATTENGAIEFDGSNYFVTSANTRYTLAKTLTVTATLDFTNTAAQNSSNLTVTLTGAADGDAVSLGVPNAAVNDNSSYSAWVSAANTVTIRFNNYSSATIDPSNGSFRVSILKY